MGKIIAKGKLLLESTKVYALFKNNPYTAIRVITRTGFLPCLSAMIPHNVEVSALPSIYEAPSLIEN